MIKTCHICHKQFALNGQHHRRTVCYKPACIKKHDKLQYQKMVASVKKTHIRPPEEKRVYVKRDKKENGVHERRCSICGRRLPRDRHYYHEKCYEKARPVDSDYCYG